RTGILLITLLTNLLKGLVGDGRQQWSPTAKHPYASFFGQRGSAAHRSQRNFFAGALQFQRIARPQLLNTRKEIGRMALAMRQVVKTEKENERLIAELERLDTCGRPLTPEE